MNKEQTAKIIEAVKALCPAQKMAELTPDVWFTVLGALDYLDVQHAVVNLGRRQTFISPGEIHTEVCVIRSNRIKAASLIYEPRPDETVEDYLARKRRQQQAAASGQIPPGPPLLALPAGAAPLVPPEIGRRVEQARAQAAHPALAVGCPWCRAQPGRWCEKPRSGSRGHKHTTAGFIHPARCDLVGAHFQPVLPPKEGN